MFVFRPTRLKCGKRDAARYYSGRYRDETTSKWRTIPLHTPDKTIAEKRLLAKVVELQREKEGLISPAQQRLAATRPLLDHLADYVQDLDSQDLAKKHVHDTSQRIRRIIAETGWKNLPDVRPAAFLEWRAKAKGSAKTRKEYHVSLRAFLNWLVRAEKLEADPIAKVPIASAKGKQERNSRAYTDEELRRLFEIAGPRRGAAYQMLTYTGQRKSEVRALVWADLSLDGNLPSALFRAETMKDDEKRAVPLHPQLAAVLRQMKPCDVNPSERVFKGCFPIYDTLRKDLKRAGIERKTALGVVHFHAFRKTWQTRGVTHGINQRVAQAILGHSTPELTANNYTDVPSLDLHSAVAKLPWISADKPTKNTLPVPLFSDAVRQLGELLKAIGREQFEQALAMVGIKAQPILVKPF